MKTFGNASVTSSSISDPSLAQTVAPDSRSLTLLFNALQARDRGDATGRFASASMECDVALLGQGAAMLTVHARGGITGSSDSCFGVCRVQVEATKVFLTLTATTGDLFGELRIQLPSATENIHVALLLLASAGEDPVDECVVALDSVDLVLS